MLLPTLWKPESKPTDVEVRIEPIGHPQVILHMLLSINGMRPAITPMIMLGYYSLAWKGVTLNMREEPEFGDGGVFSIVVGGMNLVGKMDFYLLYLQAHELLGVMLLDDDKFVTPMEFKKRST